jgi:hypothetical protein
VRRTQWSGLKRNKISEFEQKKVGDVAILATWYTSLVVIQHNINLISFMSLNHLQNGHRLTPWLIFFFIFVTFKLFFWRNSIIFWQINISYQFWADNLSKNARSVALIRPKSKIKTRKTGLYFWPLMSVPQNFNRKKSRRPKWTLLHNQ